MLEGKNIFKEERMKTETKVIGLTIALLMTACGGGGGSGPSDEEKALSLIQDYVQNDGATQTPTVHDYYDAGVIGVDVNNIEAINQYLVNFSEEDVESSTEIQWHIAQLDEEQEPEPTPEPVSTSVQEISEMSGLWEIEAGYIYIQPDGLTEYYETADLFGFYGENDCYVKSFAQIVGLY